MMWKGHDVGEFDFDDPYYLAYEHFFKTGKYKKITISAALMFSFKSGNIDENNLPINYIIFGDEERKDKFYQWPEWSHDFSTLTKMNIIMGTDKKGFVQLLHVVVYNACNPPYNSQFDFYADDIMEWNIGSRPNDELLNYFQFSCGKTTMSIKSGLLEYFEDAWQSQPDSFILFNNLLLASLSLSNSIINDIHPVVGYTILQVLTDVMEKTDNIRKNLKNRHW